MTDKNLDLEKKKAKLARIKTLVDMIDYGFHMEKDVANEKNQDIHYLRSKYYIRFEPLLVNSLLVFEKALNQQMSTLLPFLNLFSKYRDTPDKVDFLVIWNEQEREIAQLKSHFQKDDPAEVREIQLKMIGWMELIVNAIRDNMDKDIKDIVEALLKVSEQEKNGSVKKFLQDWGVIKKDD